MKHVKLIFGALISFILIFALFSVISRMPDRKSSEYLKNTGKKLESLGFKENRKTLIGVIGSYSQTQGSKAESLSKNDVEIEKITVKTYRHAKDSVMYEHEDGSKVTFSVLKNFTDGKKELLLYARLYELMGYESERADDFTWIMKRPDSSVIHVILLKNKVVANADLDRKRTDEILKILDSEK